MDGERWAELKTAFEVLADFGSAEREVRLAAIANSDPWLAERLEALLSADSAVGSSQWPLTLFGVTDSASTDDLPVTRSQQSDPLELTGRVISHFRVQGVLGSGGMGVLYRAEDLRLGRTVALKFMLPQYSIDASARDRFLVEARAASSLDHPNVCTVYEAGETEDGRPFMAMQCYQGETLKARIASNGPLTIDEAIDTIRQVLAGLGAAHQAGIVHRDLKPGNLMLVADGPLKILDFGLARVRDMNVSHPELLPGTVAYMSPEQLDGPLVDRRTDLWSTGVVLYEMLTGRTPFGRGHDLASVHAILVDEPLAPSTIREGVPPKLDVIVGKLLRKRPDERYSTAAEVLADLDGVASATKGEARRPSSGRTGMSVQAWAGVITALVIVGGVAAAAGIRGRIAADERSGSGAVLSPTSPRPSVAVLPFVDLSPERDQDYFSDGITEELIHHVSRMDGLTVAASTSSARFRETTVDAREVGRRLGVVALVEGSVRRDGERLRISARLVSTESGNPLWSETYERRIDDIFAVQEEISRAIAEALRLRLTSPSAPDAGQPTPTASVEAYELFLRGRFFANRRTEQALERAAEYYQQAIDIDPGFSRAHAGLAETYIATRRSLPSERFRLGREAALQALAIDSTLAEAHTAMAWIEMWYERDWAAAEAHFRQAFESNPNYIWAHQWYAAYLSATGRLEEALAAMTAARLIDPLSVATITHVGSELFWLGRYDEAMVQYERALELNPEFFMAEWGRGRALVLLGRPAEAIGSLQREGTDYVGFFQAGLLGHAYAVAGQEDEARRILADLRSRRSAGEYVAPTEFAAIHIGLGELDEALDWLELHEADRGARIFLKVDPMFDPVRNSPRFVELVSRLGLG